MTIIKYHILLSLLLLSTFAIAQNNQYWQQRADYQMTVDFDVNTNQYSGEQTITYTNNSPDELKHVYFHLYNNAFQPNSMMDKRSAWLTDADQRVGSRISKLKPEEVGYCHVSALTMNGAPVEIEEAGTILEGKLPKVIAPGETVVFKSKFTAQSPVQIRRSGRDNAEDIRYSMSQWYPKISEYDYRGWQANPYIGREFYGIWGDFDVTISIDNQYIIGATGYLQNPNSIGYGYAEEGQPSPKRKKGEKLTWHFKAPNVHDFVWAADPDYSHTKLKAKNGPMMHFIFQENDKNKEAWAKLPNVMDEVFDYCNKNFGQYQYDKYSFIQGGDGGMEYPMATLITGNRPFISLVGVAVHELMHSWYQMMLATDESHYPWMDEGFTSYAATRIMNHLKAKGLISGTPVEHPAEYLSTTKSYVGYAKSGYEEPLITHADHFNTNWAYGVSSYVKGSVFLNQLEYIVGKAAFDKSLLAYFDHWHGKHPNDVNFVREVEKVADLELDWYREYWVNTTHTIDYAIDTIVGKKKKTTVFLKRIGIMPMPIDIEVTYKNGKTELFNIPLRIMRGHKPAPSSKTPYTVLPDWPWVNTSYEFEIPVKMKKIASVKIDPSGAMADIDLENNTYVKK